MQQSPSNVPRSGDYLALWKFYCLYDDYGVKTHFVPQIEESDPAQSVRLEASTRKERFERKKLHPRRYSFCNNPPQTSGDRVIIWSFGNLIACTMTMGSKHTSFPKLKKQTCPKVCPWKRQLGRSDLRGKNFIRGGTHFATNPVETSRDLVIIWRSESFFCLYDDYGVETHFVPQIEESDPAQSVRLEASTRKERFEGKKLHPRRYSFCNNPPQTSGDRVIIWSFGNLIACTMTMGSKHTSFPQNCRVRPRSKCAPGSVYSQAVF